MATPSFIFGQGTKYKTPEQLQEARRRVQQLMSGGPQDYSRPGGWLYALGDGLGAAIEQRRINQGEKYADEQRQKGSALFGQLMNGFGGAGAAYPSTVAAGGSPTSAAATGTVPQGKFNFGENADALRSGIIETAQAIGADPVDLATAISYETAGTFDPTKAGPRTQYGQHRGLIQFGEPQAEKYGVDWNNPLGSQLGANGAVANYFRSSGFKPGMSGLDLYSTINAGSPGRYSASDANNGGAPGSVRDKWEKQMTGHRQKALALLGSGNKPQSQGVQVASLDPSIGLGSAPSEAEALFGPNADVSQADIEFAKQATGPVGGATIRAGDYNPDASRGNAPANGARATFGGPQLTYDDGGLRFVDEGAQRVAAQSAPPTVAPHDFTGNPQLSAGAGMQFQGGQPQQMAALPPQQAPQAPAGPSAELLRQNDTMWGGALAPQGQAPQQVADASGYFPPAPSMDRAPVQPQAAPQNNNRLQMLSEVLSNPFVPDEQKRVAQFMFQQEMQQGQEMRQQQAARENWLFQQQYEEAAQARDPLRQAQLIEAQAKVKALQNPDAMLPDSVRALNIRAQQAGLVPGTEEYQQFMISGGKGPLVTVNNGQNGSEFVKKSDEAAAKRFDDIVMAGQTAPQTMADMQQLLDLGAQIGTGKGAQVLAAIGPYADALGIKIDGLNDIQAFEAITSRLAPQMRAVGSGSSSDRDVAMFLQSLPNLRNTQGGNEIIANTMKAVSQNKINAAEIARQAQRGDITWQDADRQISQLPNPYELFKQFQTEAQKATGGWSNVGGGVKIRVKP